MNKKFLQERMDAQHQSMHALDALMIAIQREASDILFLKATAKIANNLQEDLSALLASYALLQQLKNDTSHILLEVETYLVLENRYEE